MDYLSSGYCCVGFNSGSQPDSFKVEKKKKIIDVDKNEIVEFNYYILIDLFEVGKTYKVVEKWALTKNGAELKIFDTEDDCQKAYKELVETLKQDHKVFEI